MNTKTLIAIIASVIAILVFIFGAYMLTNNSQPATYPKINKISAADHVTWSTAKKNILVEYTDFECPACRNFHTLINQMVASGSADIKIKNKVTFVMRDFPLYQIHPNSMTAAYAAEAAGKQGKFFEMGNLLFDNQDNWANLANPTDYFIGLAKQLNLNIDQFKTDMNSQAVKDKVNADIASGNEAGVDRTPTFFLNGQKLDNIQSFNQFRSLLINL